MRLSKSVRAELSDLLSLDSDIRQEVFKGIESNLRVYLRLKKSYESELSAKDKRKILKELKSAMDKATPLLSGMEIFEKFKNEVNRFQKDFTAKSGRREDLAFKWLLSKLSRVFKSNTTYKITATYYEAEGQCKGKFPQFIKLCLSPLDARYKKTESALCGQIKEAREQRFKNPFDLENLLE